MGDKETKFKLLLNRVDFERLLSKKAVIMMAVRSCVPSCDLGKWEKIKNINKLPTLENEDDNDDERKIKRSSPAPGKIKGSVATVVKRGQQASVQ